MNLLGTFQAAPQTVQTVKHPNMAVNSCVEVSDLARSIGEVQKVSIEHIGSKRASEHP